MKKELYDGFEGDSLSDIWKHTKFEPRAVELQSEIVRKGKQALKITIHKGDKAEFVNKTNKFSERDELLKDKKLGPVENMNYSYSFSIYLPKDFLIIPIRLVLAQWKQNDANNNALVDNPVLALRYVNGELSITLHISEERIKLFTTNEEVRGKWLDFKFNVRFTRTKAGFIKAWMNDKEVVNYKGVTAYSKKITTLRKVIFISKWGFIEIQ